MMALIGHYGSLFVNPDTIFICLTQRYPNPNPNPNHDVHNSIKSTQGANKLKKKNMERVLVGVQSGGLALEHGYDNESIILVQHKVNNIIFI